MYLWTSTMQLSFCESLLRSDVGFSGTIQHEEQWRADKPVKTGPDKISWNLHKTALLHRFFCSDLYSLRRSELVPDGRGWPKFKHGMFLMQRKAGLLCQSIWLLWLGQLDWCILNEDFFCDLLCSHNTQPGLLDSFKDTSAWTDDRFFVAWRGWRLLDTLRAPYLIS